MEAETVHFTSSQIFYSCIDRLKMDKPLDCITPLHAWFCTRSTHHNTISSAGAARRPRTDLVHVRLHLESLLMQLLLNATDLAHNKAAGNRVGPIWSTMDENNALYWSLTVHNLCSFRNGVYFFYFKNVFLT